MSRPWWRTAVVYEVYVRSFADGSGDGVGDLAGLRARLPHLQRLGVDALWVTPWYPSPMADGGYDVTDHCDVDPRLGSLAEAAVLLDEAHALGLRVLVDVVANHTSVEHPWFAAALAAGPGSAERERYVFRDGRDGGATPPNDWVSAFGGPAWTRVLEPDGTAGQWYLHTFAAEQPDLDGTRPQVQADLDAVLRFWLDLGVDGLRIDAAPALAKAPGLPFAGHAPDARFDTRGWVDSPQWDVEEVHEVLRRWRRLVAGYEGDRVLVAEAVVRDPQRLSRYVRPDELHTAFAFDVLTAPWEAEALRCAVTTTLAALQPAGAPASWVLSSHDETRHATRFGRADTRAVPLAPGAPPAVDHALGTRRARAAALLLLALPGGVTLYQGEELGLPEVEDLPDEVLQDPAFRRSGGLVRGRDGCRVPLPWSGTAPPFGFAPDGVEPWLPQPPDWRALTVQAQEQDPDSTLALYRSALALRRRAEDLQTDALRWEQAPAGVLAFTRGRSSTCVVNLSPEPVPLTGWGSVLLASEPSVADVLPPDCAAWLRR